VLGKAVLEELVKSDSRLVSKQVDKNVEDAFQELKVVQMDGVRVNAIRKHVLLDRLGGREQHVVHNFEELGWVSLFGRFFIVGLGEADAYEGKLQTIVVFLKITCSADQ